MKKLSQIIFGIDVPQIVKECDSMYDHLILEWGNELLWESKGIPDGLREDAAYITNEVIKFYSEYSFLPKLQVSTKISVLVLDVSKIPDKVSFCVDPNCSAEYLSSVYTKDNVRAEVITKVFNFDCTSKEQTSKEFKSLLEFLQE